MPNSDKRGGLGERFEGFGAAPSDQLWGNISAQLDEKNGKKRVVWWWFFGGTNAFYRIFRKRNKDELLVYES